ncbi:MAG: thiamine phosphate synthase [Pseudomonadota bacterium]
MPDTPQIYLVTPARLDLSTFGDRMAAVMDTVEIACARLSTAGMDADAVMRSGDHLRQICHARDVALVVETHTPMVGQLGLDGVHLPPGGSVREARKVLGKDGIVGAACGTSRHAGLNAGEAGADYVAFGPMTPDPRLGEEAAEVDLFRWWSEMIEVPCVAEGGLNRTLVEALSPVADFLAVGDEIWAEDDPAGALKRLLGS